MPYKVNLPTAAAGPSGPDMRGLAMLAMAFGAPPLPTDASARIPALAGAPKGTTFDPVANVDRAPGTQNLFNTPASDLPAALQRMGAAATPTMTWMDVMKRLYGLGRF
jgi:hypothetical protein